MWLQDVLPELKPHDEGPQPQVSFRGEGYPGPKRLSRNPRGPKNWGDIHGTGAPVNWTSQKREGAQVTRVYIPGAGVLH